MLVAIIASLMGGSKPAPAATVAASTAAPAAGGYAGMVSLVGPSPLLLTQGDVYAEAGIDLAPGFAPEGQAAPTVSFEYSEAGVAFSDYLPKVCVCYVGWMVQYLFTPKAFAHQTSTTKTLNHSYFPDRMLPRASSTPRLNDPNGALRQVGTFQVEYAVTAPWLVSPLTLRREVVVQDVDECTYAGPLAAFKHTCSAAQACTNTVGSFTCN